VQVDWRIRGKGPGAWAFAEAPQASLVCFDRLANRASDLKGCGGRADTRLEGHDEPRRLPPGRSPVPSAAPVSRSIRFAGDWAVGVLVLWSIVLALGWAAAVKYANTPGVREDARRLWPERSPIPLSQSRLTLLLFAHPRCPCTRATMAELAELVARCGDGLEVHVVFRVDPELDRDAESLELWTQAAGIPGVQIHEDPRGEAALLFGAHTSGHVSVFDPDGRLVFSGGITPARGHAGPNSGFDSIAALATDPDSAAAHTPIFGCSLHDGPNLAPVSATP